MKTYDINFKPSVEKDLKGLPKSLILRVMKKIVWRTQKEVKFNANRIEGSWTSFFLFQ